MTGPQPLPSWAGGGSPVTVLVAVDDSAAAFDAARLAVDLAGALGGRLVAVCVVEGVAAGNGDGWRARAAEGALRFVAELARDRDVPAGTRIVHGEVAAQVLDQARRTGAAFVVVGRVDRPGVRLPHIGHTAERILEFCQVPVVVVPAARGPAVDVGAAH